MEVFTCQIGMLSSDRPIDDPNCYFMVTAGQFHQRGEPDQFQWIHKESSAPVLQRRRSNILDHWWCTKRKTGQTTTILKER